MSFIKLPNNFSFYWKRFFDQSKKFLQKKIFHFTFWKWIYTKKLKNKPYYLFNLGIKYYLEEKFDQALYYLKADLKFNTQKKFNQKIHFFLIGKILLLKNKKKKSIKYFKKQIFFFETYQFKMRSLLPFYLYSLIILKQLSYLKKIDLYSIKIKNYIQYYYERNWIDKKLIPYHMFLIAFLKGNYQEALTHLFPIKNSNFFINKRLFQIQKLQFVEQILICYSIKKQFKKVLRIRNFKIGTKYPIILYQIIAYCYLKQYKTAKTLLLNLIRAHYIKNFKFDFNLGNLYFLLKNYNLSSYSYSQAIFRYPHFYEAHFNLAILYHKFNLIESAKELYHKTLSLIKKKPSTPRNRKIISKIFYNLGSLYYQELNLQKSIYYYTKSYIIYPRIHCLENILSIKLFQASYKNFDRNPPIKMIQQTSFVLILLIIIIALLLILSV